MHKQNLAPIVLFVYNRPWHTAQTLESLKRNSLAKDSVLYVFADGPKENATAADKLKITETRNLFKVNEGFKDLVIFKKDKNDGLAKSIIAGVTEIVNKYGKVIVLEDDLILATDFLKFMNDCLDIYEHRQNVYSVNGFMFPIESQEKKVVLLPYVATWGWATWNTKWKAFSTNMPHKKVLQDNRFLANRFNLADYKYTNMLNFGNNSWGIKWYYSVFIKNGLSVFPTESLVSNIGFDGSGENCGPDEKVISQLNAYEVKISLIEDIDLEFLGRYTNFFKESRKKTYMKKLTTKIKKMVR